MKEIYEMKGAGRSIRGIAEELGIARNMVRRYLKSPEAMRPRHRPSRGSKLDTYTEYVDRRVSEGLELGDALRQHTETFRRITSVPSEMILSGAEPPLPTETKSRLFSIAHNALTNAFRHANAGRRWSAWTSGTASSGCPSRTTGWACRRTLPSGARGSPA